MKTSKRSKAFHLAIVLIAIHAGYTPVMAVGWKDKLKKLAPVVPVVNEVAAKHVENYEQWAAVALVSSELVKLLNEKDQQQVANASATTAEKNEKQVWANPKTGVKGSSEVVNTRRQTDKVAVRRTAQIAAIPPLEIIGRTYKTTRAATLHADTRIESGVTGSFQAGESLEVTGKVKTADWYFVSKNGVGIGFAQIAHFNAAPEAASVAIPVAANPEQSVAASESTVEIEREYKTISQEVVLADGTIHTEQVTLVKDVNGKWVKAAPVS